MAKKIKLTRPELKRYRDALTRFERYLPMLKLKQQQLQMTLRGVVAEMRTAKQAIKEARRKFDAYSEILSDIAGLNVRQLAQCERTRTETVNVAGVRVPVFQGVDFPPVSYSLFATPPWVDQALADLRQISRHQAELDVLTERYRLLHNELVKVVQRVNLFEKVKIPECREVIRVIRIRLGDEMTAAVGRAKIAKTKIAQSEREIYGAKSPAEATEARAV